MRNRLAALVISFVLPALAHGSVFGGMDAGGSEHGLVCFSNVETAQAVKASVGNISDDQLPALVSIEPVDLWLARMPVGHPARTPVLQMPIGNENEMDFLERMLAGVGRSVAPLAIRLRSALKAFQPFDLKIKWVPISMQMIHDDGLNLRIDRLPFCAITMIAWQIELEGANFLQIDPRLYQRMDTASRAVTWLHELLYFIAREKGQKDSRATRKLVSVLLLQKGQITVGEVADLARDLGFVSAREASTVKQRDVFYPR